MIAAADRRLTSNGRYADTQRKLFPIPYHHGAISSFGLADFKDHGGKLRRLSLWLPGFIRANFGPGVEGTLQRSRLEAQRRYK